MDLDIISKEREKMKQQCTNLEGFLKKEVRSIPHTKKYREIKLQIIVETHDGKVSKETIFHHYCMTPEFIQYAEKYRQRYCSRVCEQRTDCEIAQKYMKKK